MTVSEFGEILNSQYETIRGDELLEVVIDGVVYIVVGGEYDSDSRTVSIVAVDKDDK
jgi:hypothetical protein